MLTPRVRDALLKMADIHDRSVGWSEWTSPELTPDEWAAFRWQLGRYIEQMSVGLTPSERAVDLRAYVALQDVFGGGQ